MAARAAAVRAAAVRARAVEAMAAAAEGMAVVAVAAVAVAGAGISTLGTWEHSLEGRTTICIAQFRIHNSQGRWNNIELATNIGSNIARLDTPPRCSWRTISGIQYSPCC